MALALLALVSVGQGVRNGFTCVDFHWESAALFLRGENPYQWFFDGRVFQGVAVDATQAPSTIAFILPFGLLEHETANTLWDFCNLGWTALFLFFVYQLWFVGKGLRFYVFACLFLMSVPWRVGMGSGQSTMFSLAFFLAAVWTLDRRKVWWITGLLLAPALFKYTVTVPLAFYFVMKRAWRPLLLCGAVHAALTVALGWWTQTNPLTLVLQSMQVGQALNTEGGLADLSGLAFWCGLADVRPVALAGYVLFGLVLLATAVRPRLAGSADLEWLVYLALVADLALYHRFYDLVVLAFPLVSLTLTRDVWTRNRVLAIALAVLVVHVFYYSRLSLIWGHPAYVPVCVGLHLLALALVLTQTIRMSRRPVRLTLAGVALALLAGCRTAPEWKDLSAPSDWTSLDESPVAVVTVGGLLPVVTDEKPQNRWAAGFLVQTIEEMTGRRPPLYVELKGQRGKWPKGGLFIGGIAANDDWERPSPEAGAAAFRVVASAGCVRFLGRADYAVFDWCERALGLRFYCEDGKCVERRREIVVPAVDYSDRPVFDCRQLSWPAPSPWLRVARCGSEHRGGVSVHQPARWYTNAAVRAEAPDIFETGQTPMLCYGNPATLEYYKRRIDRHIAGQEDSDGIVDTNRKVVTVCQWDAPIRCSCRWCKESYDTKAGFRGEASPIIWGRFTRRLADWLKEAHPDYMVSFLPYLNTCQVPRELLPKGRTDRHRGARIGRVLRRSGTVKLANAEAELCTMPGLALLKEPDVRRREERLIRDWHRVTRKKVLNWHYSCWPRDWTSAPYVYGKTIQRHYADMAEHMTGSYVCGDPQDVRQQLSHYVWMKCLWNPAVDVEAIYDEYARRMFGAGAAPMRELIRMQEDGWNRRWGGEECTAFNVFERSFPRPEAEKMRALLVEAHRLAAAAGEATAVRRIVTYASGLNDFMLESDALAALRRGRGAARRVIRPGETNVMMTARSVRYPTPWAGTTVVTAVEGDALVFTVRCEEPAVAKMDFDDEPVDDFVWGNDNLDFAFAGGERHKVGAVVSSGASMVEPNRISAQVAHDDTGWTAHVRVKLTADELKAGELVGNVSRWRVGDRRLPPEVRVAGSRYEHSRLNTVYTQPNDDPAAFVEFLIK